MVTEIEQRVLEFVEISQEGLVDLLRELIAFKTVTPREGESAQDRDFIEYQQVIARLLQDLEADRIETWEVDASSLERFPGSGVISDRDLSQMPVLVGTFKGTGGSRSLILNGHYDVVPEGQLEHWQHPPFEGLIEDGKMYGRGACDMKGGIAAMLVALQAIYLAGVRLKGDLFVQSVMDEEMSCMGTLACCQKGYRADAAFIPEPTDMKVLVAMRGSIYGKIHVRGRGGHTEMEQPHWKQGGAVNAIDKSVKVIQAMKALSDDWHASPNKQHTLLSPNAVIPTSIAGGGEWEVTYPDLVTISFGAMFLPGTHDIEQEIEEYVVQATGDDDWLCQHPPEFKFNSSWHYGAEVDEDEPIVQLGLQVLEDLDYSPEMCGFGSLTDAIHLINYSNIPTISIGPESQPAHMAEEYVEISKLVDLSKMIALLVLRWCGIADRELQ